MSKITVIGSLVMDMVATMPEFPEAGETVLGTDIGFYPGGKGANQCVAIARLGGDVEMVGMLGNDSNGDVFRKIMKDEGIKCDNLLSCDSATAVAQIQINKSGQNRICVIPSANHKFDFSHLDGVDSVIKNTELIVLQLEMRIDVTEEIIKRASAYGVKVLLNPAPATSLSPDIFPLVDYITPNETELSILTGLPTETDDEVIAAARALLEKGVKCVISTLGDRGALIVNKNGAKIIKGYKVKAIDTVAAGDSFNGAFAVAITEGKSEEDAVAFANAMGALTVQVKGAIPSMHTRAEVDDFIKTNS